MDDPALDERRHEQALRGLGRINAVSAADRTIWRALRALSLASGGGPLRILDAACGGGDVAVRLDRRARRAGLALAIEGCDISRRAVDFARRRAESRSAAVGFFQHDVVKAGLPGGYDVVVAGLFLHHLDEGQALRFLDQASSAARRMVLVNDLNRSMIGYLLASAGTRILCRGDVVRVDGPRSVRAAFTADEARALARRAGLDGAAVARRWPGRWLLVWRRA